MIAGTRVLYDARHNWLESNNFSEVSSLLLVDRHPNHQQLNQLLMDVSWRHNPSEI